MTIDQLIEHIREYNSAVDSEMMRLAYDFAVNAHRGQMRINGEPYIQHALGAAYHLAKVKMDDATIIAGLLHDVPDETTVSLEQVYHDFGSEVGMLVEGVSKLGKLKYRGKERYAENLRKMFVSIAKDIRIIIIKFADRLHNLESLHVLPRDKQERIAREVLEIYAPIADRLGIGSMKVALDESAFQYLQPEIAADLARQVRPKTDKKEHYLARVKQLLSRELEDNHIQVFSIVSRVKYIYSIYLKMQKKGIDGLDAIYDLVAMRIVVDSIGDCYAVLGIIHQLWRPLRGRIKDYISQPKPNHYRSLHTTVFCEDGEIVEFQIRTRDMDREAKYGIAAHWHYNESRKNSQTITKSLDWLKDILKLQETTEGNDEEFLRSLKVDIFQHRIFVFTPKGDVINLPEGSTAVDFAYHIHSDVGRRCSGARVNDIMQPLDTVLVSGDVVEIITERNRKKPSGDWLLFVKTHVAKSHIKAQLKE